MGFWANDAIQWICRRWRHIHWMHINILGKLSSTKNGKKKHTLSAFGQKQTIVVDHPTVNYQLAVAIFAYQWKLERMVVNLQCHIQPTISCVFQKIITLKTLCKGWFCFHTKRRQSFSSPSKHPMMARALCIRGCDSPKRGYESSNSKLNPLVYSSDYWLLAEEIQLMHEKNIAKQQGSHVCARNDV